MKTEIGFLLKLKDRLMRLQNGVREAHRRSIEIEKESIIAKAKCNSSTKNEGSLSKSQYSTPKFVDKLEGIQLSVRQIGNNLQSDMIDIKSNCRLSSSPGANEGGSDIIKKLNPYSSMSENNEVEEIMVYSNYRSYVNIMNERLIDCELAVKGVTQRVKREGKPKSYGKLFKKLIRKDKK